MTDPSTEPSLFCALPAQRIVMSNALAVAIRDAHPVSPGHTLVIPRRHVASFFDATGEERLALFELLDEARRVLDAELRPAAYNIGVNDGAAAGQTIAHLHVHLMPRYAGDEGDPRGVLGSRFISITGELVELNELFTDYWRSIVPVARTSSIAFPFSRLHTEPFWKLVPLPGRDWHHHEGQRERRAIRLRHGTLSDYAVQGTVAETAGYVRCHPIVYCCERFGVEN